MKRNTLILLTGLVGCSGDAGRDPGATSTGITTTTTATTTTATASAGTDSTSDSSGTDSASGSASATSTTDDSAGSGTTDNSSSGGLKFDTENQFDIGNAGDTGNNTGCQKIDFLFVVDNSGSMGDEQDNLIQSFPGFINSIQNTVMAMDYHILVTDTDGGGGGSINISCSPDPSCCVTNCQTFPQATCNGNPCMPVGSDCDITLGAGIISDQNGNDCGFTSGERYMLETQANLTQTFECAALVGTLGSGDEHPVEAAMEAITTLNPPGECNENFLRDDAILVVTILTDEEDINKTPGNPPDWVNTMVQAKNGDEKAVVALAVVGDTDLPNPVCTMFNGTDGAEGSPRLRQWADSFTYGMWGSICAPDYAPFFDLAVSVIDSACDDFKPPG